MSRLKTDAIRNTSASADALTFDTNGNTKIADSEELQLGTGADLKIWHDGSNAYMSNDTGAFVIQDSHAGANAVIIRKGAEVELLHNNVLACETSATGLAFPSGKGIDFSATADGSGASSVSELFDDYEEGEFTPTMSAGYTSPGYHSDTGGWYTKIGNTVYARVYMRLNAGTPNSDGVRIAGLPFSHAGAFYATASGYIPTGDVGSTVHPLLVLFPSGTEFRLYVQNQTSVGTRSGSDLNANCELIYWITYKVA